jgi:hypothetical protein
MYYHHRFYKSMPHFYPPFQANILYNAQKVPLIKSFLVVVPYSSNRFRIPYWVQRRWTYRNRRSEGFG